MISSEIIRGYIDTMILFVLIEGDSYGYSILKRITELSQEEYTIKETTLYSAFSRLEKTGAISSYPGEITHGKPRTYYKVSGIGIELYKQKCQEWSSVQKVISNFIMEEVINGNT